MSSRISRLVRSRKDWQLESEDARTTYARRDHSASIEDDPDPHAVIKIWRVVNTGGAGEMSFPMECICTFRVFNDALPEQMITEILQNGAIYTTFKKNIAKDQLPVGEIERGLNGLIDALDATHTAVKRARSGVRNSGLLT